MAEELIAEVDPADVEIVREIRLKDIVLDVRFSDQFSFLSPIDEFRRELIFQWRLLRDEWGQAHLLTLLTGFAAFLLGSLSQELFSGGDATLTGLDGLKAIGGFEYFQILLSGILWVWFFVQISVNFPIMRGHIINFLIIWISTFAAQLSIHSTMPEFPIGLKLGDMLIGVILTAIGGFFTYFFWRAVVETRDLHVQEHHLHADVRIMEEQMAEHSLYGWTIMVISWIVLLIISSWAGAHFVADRFADNISFLILHILSGMFSIYLLMHIIWFPQKMLGEGTQIRTKAAIAAEADLVDSGGVVMSEDGVCPSCKEAAPISRNDNGMTLIDCPSEGCNRRGPSGTKCEGCDEEYPHRHKCSGCGTNSPVVDYLPDSEAW
ncbi:MAG: hypothetical protein QGI21_03450 [Candidatus Poseidoniaceae archaeon]|jgi:hypothetical protein|nr:hypothetical protein [Candidatus Poseidoniaceae archaeon]